MKPERRQMAFWGIGKNGGLDKKIQKDMLNRKIKMKRTLHKNQNAPVITRSFAVDKGHYGFIWKLYIEAEDPDGDMEKIAVVVDQIGYGHYPTEWIFLKPECRAYLKGYLQWNTFSSKTSDLPEWTRISAKVSIFDKAGNESNEVIFPFTFESGIKNQYEYQLPSPFDQGDILRIGHIMIDLLYLRI